MNLRIRLFISYIQSTCLLLICVVNLILDSRDSEMEFGLFPVIDYQPLFCNNVTVMYNQGFEDARPSEIIRTLIAVIQ